MTKAHAADQKAILDLDAKWGEAATRHDVDAVVAFYASDATLVWPDSSAHAAFRKVQAPSELSWKITSWTLSTTPR